MKKSIIVLLSSLIFISTSWAGEVKHPIDVWFGNCVNGKIATVEQLKCIDQAYEMWDKELNKNYKELMDKLDPAGQKVLKDAQKSWIQQRDLEFKLIDKTLGSRQGTLYLTVSASNKMECVKRRALQLKDYSGWMEEN